MKTCKSPFLGLLWEIYFIPGVMVVFALALAFMLSQSGIAKDLNNDGRIDYVKIIDGDIHILYMGPLGRYEEEYLVYDHTSTVLQLFLVPSDSTSELIDIAYKLTGDTCVYRLVNIGNSFKGTQKISRGISLGIR